MIHEQATSPSAFVEQKLTALAQWWVRHCKDFSLWYLSQTTEEQRKLLLKIVPDLPPLSAFSRESEGSALLPSDVILPEFSQEGMLASNGRVFILFMTRRLSATDLCLSEDIRMLRNLAQRKQLPSFSNNAFVDLDTPFVDPLDPEERIKSLTSETPNETREEIAEHLNSGRLVDAEVWLALKLRRMSIATLLEALTAEHYNAVPVKPSPSYVALLTGELAQQQALAQSDSAIVEEER